MMPDKTNEALGEMGLVRIAQMIDRMFAASDARKSAARFGSIRDARAERDGKSLRRRAAA